MYFLTGGAGTGKLHTIKCIFNEVDTPLTKESNNSILFGNVSILAVGDFYQIPLVTAKPFDFVYSPAEKSTFSWKLSNVVYSFVLGIK
jgi:branched-subunit amino acid permease